MAAVARLLSSKTFESFCLLLLIYLSLARFPISNLKLNRKVSQHELLFVSKTISRPEIRSFTTPMTEFSAKRLEDNRVVNVLCIHLFQKSILALFLISLANDVATSSGPAMNNLGDVLANFPRCPGWKIAHLNIRSILGKMDDLKLLLKDKPFDVFTISETWLHTNITDSESQIPGYSFVRQDRINKAGGGSMISFATESLIALDLIWPQSRSRVLLK